MGGRAYAAYAAGRIGISKIHRCVTDTSPPLKSYRNPIGSRIPDRLPDVTIFQGLCQLNFGCVSTCLWEAFSTQDASLDLPQSSGRGGIRKLSSTFIEDLCVQWSETWFP